MEAPTQWIFDSTLSWLQIVRLLIIEYTLCCTQNCWPVGPNLISALHTITFLGVFSDNGRFSKKSISNLIMKNPFCWKALLGMEIKINFVWFHTPKNVWKWSACNKTARNYHWIVGHNLELYDFLRLICVLYFWIGILFCALFVLMLETLKSEKKSIELTTCLSNGLTSSSFESIYHFEHKHTW
jgi:L-lactate permease